MDWQAKIRQCFETEAVLYTSHARREMKKEPFGEIDEEEIYEAIFDCEILKEYPDDKPYPSVLLFGMTNAKRPLHIVSAYNAEEQKAIIITVYHPDPQLWEDYRRRKK